MSQLAQALVALDGQVGLVAQDGNFLGLMSSDTNHPNSIINPNTYGNPYEDTICNQNSQYGGQHGLQSPYNSFCLNPPIMIDVNDKQLALVTRNHNLITNGLDIIDLDFMLGLLYGIAGQQISNSNEQFSNTYNLRAQEIAGQQISNSNEQFSNTYNLRAQEIAAEQGRQLADAYTEASINQSQASAALMASILGSSQVCRR
jgi:hypothetical protein